MTVNVYGQGAAPANMLPLPPPYVRPAWMRAIPTVGVTDEKIVGLFAVYPPGTGNYAAFTCTGNYTVDWGDGTTENVSSGVTASHEYDFTDSDLANTDCPVTITASTGTFTRASHGYGLNDEVVLYRVVTTTGLVEGQRYYVINPTATTFQISATKGGSAVVLTNDGSAALSPFKQAIITITPQGGAQLTTANFNVKHPAIPPSTMRQAWLDLQISLPNASSTGLTLYGAVNNGLPLLDCVTIRNLGAQTSMAWMFYSCSALRKVDISGVGCVTDMSYLFYSCASLTDVSITPTAQVTNMRTMFRNCNSLLVAPSLDTSGATDTREMFNTCQMLQHVPQLDLSKSTNCYAMFQQCYALQSINIASPVAVGCDTSYMFKSCYALESAYLPNWGNSVNCEAMFYGCYALKTVYLPNTQSNTKFGDGFDSCYSLESISLPTTNALQQCWTMFYNCYNLKNVYMPNTANVTDMSYMFYNCYSLQSAPNLNTQSVTTASRMFYGCSALQSTPASYTFPQAVDCSQMFQLCVSLKTAPVFYFGASPSYMSSMFQYCYSLINVPLSDLSNVTYTDSMFQGCYNLQSVPAFNLSNVLNTQSMFNTCASLKTVPAFDLSKATVVSYMFTYCAALTTVPSLNMPLVTAAVNMFAFCTNLNYVGLTFGSAKVVSASGMFSGCVRLKAVPVFDTSTTTTLASIFSGCAEIETIPAFNLGGLGQAGGGSLSDTAVWNYAYGARLSHSLSSKYNKAALEYYFGNLGIAFNSSQTLTVTNNPGVTAAVSKTSLTTTALSTTINMSDTSSLVAGMFCTNATIWAPVNVAGDVTADTITLNGHNIPNGTPVSFSSLGTVTGVTAYKVYYVVNAAANTFQIALTAGGSPIDLTGSNGTMAIKWYSKIVTINTNTSIVLDAPAPTSQTGQTISFRYLDVSQVLLKNWAITY